MRSLCAAFVCTSNAGVATSPMAEATNGTQVPPVASARTRRTPSHRSIRSSPERWNSASEPAMSSGAGSSTRKLASTVNATQRSGPHGAAQLVQAEADATLDGPQRQAGGAGDLLVRLAAHIGTPNQVGLARWQGIDQLPQRPVPSGGVQFIGNVGRLRIRQMLGQIGHVLAVFERTPAQVIQATVADDREQPGPIRAALGVESIRAAPQRQENILDDVFSLAP